MVIVYYLLMSAVAFVMYWADKRRAVRGDWRIPEWTLHTIELLGGWPGAWLAQRMFRHKWNKMQYVRGFWMIVAAHVLGWLLYLKGF